MRVLLKLELDCDPDAAWLAIRSPRVFRAVAAPLTTFDSLEPDGFPDVWADGEHRVRVKALGVLGVGVQVVRVRERSTGTTRILRDTGRGLSGALALVTAWQHSMAVSAAPGGKTLYRDELKYEAGALTVLLWPVFWAYWQWRGLRLVALAPGWSA